MQQHHSVGGPVTSNFFAGRETQDVPNASGQLRCILKQLQWATANACWIVEVLETPTGFRCDYADATSSDRGRGSFLGNSVDQLLAQAHRAIENIDGLVKR